MKPGSGMDLVDPSRSEGFYSIGVKQMFGRVVDFFIGIACRNSRSRRVRRIQNSVARHCPYCHASLSCFKKLCRNCLTPCPNGLVGENWIAKEVGRQVDYLAFMDRVKYKRISTLSA
jgi:hypothetical protein